MQKMQISHLCGRRIGEMGNNLTWKSTICTVLEHLQSNDANDLPGAEFVDVLRAMQLISHSNLVINTLMR